MHQNSALWGKKKIKIYSSTKITKILWLNWCCSESKVHCVSNTRTWYKKKGGGGGGSGAKRVYILYSIYMETHFSGGIDKA